MSDIRNALQKGAANVINGYANQLRIQIEENDVLRAERAELRAAISKAVDDLATIELEQEIYAAQGIRKELAAALEG